jgi:hypothetical protein
MANEKERPRLLQYPSNLATSIGQSLSGTESLDGYYGHWMLITIYEPEKSTFTFTTEQEAGEVATRAGAALATPFLLDFIGLPGSLNAFLTSGVIGALGFANLDEQQLNVATSGLDFSTEGIDKNIRDANANDNSNLVARLEKIKSARTQGRIPESRASLGLGLRYERSPISIALPMPKQIKSNYGFDYSETDFSGMKVINSAIAYARSKSEDYKNPFNPNEMNLSSPDVQGILSFVETLPAAAFDEAFKLLGLQPNLLDYTRAGRNQAKIPYSEKLFKSVKRRTFEVDYNFLPKNQEEVLQIYDIVKTLKKHAHPSKSNNSYYYTTPSEFIVDFQFLGTRNIFLPKFGRLAIESIDVDYGSSSGFSTLRPISGNYGEIANNFGINTTFIPTSNTFVSPTEINLKISFSELELLTQERIEEGY